MPSLLKRINIPIGKEHKQTLTNFKCQVMLMEGNPIDFTVEVDAVGEWLFDEVCQAIGNLEEKDYFGLRFSDADNQRRWLDCSLQVYKQVKHLSPIIVSLRVKHYPSHPADNLKQDLARYLVFQQLKRDLLLGRLYCQQTAENAQLAAYIVQSEFGDYDEVDTPNYLSGIKFILNQTPKMESQIYEEHKALKGLTATEAEHKFFEKAFTLDSYGIDPVSVRDRNGNSFFIGLSHAGVATFYGNKRAHLFKWADINAIQFQEKMFLLEYNVNAEVQAGTEDFRFKKRHVLGFKCESRNAASVLWKWAVERRAFFTLNRSAEAKVLRSGGGLFNKKRRNSFRFSGRCQRELLTSSDYFLNLNSSLPGVVRLHRNLSTSTPRVTRHRSFRANSESEDSDGEPARKSRPADRYATFPRRARPPGLDSDFESSTPKRNSNPLGAVSAQVHTPDSALPDELPSAILMEEAENDAAFSETDSGLPEDHRQEVAEAPIVSNHVRSSQTARGHDETDVVNHLDQVLEQHENNPKLQNGSVVSSKQPKPSKAVGICKAMFTLAVGFSLLALLGVVLFFEADIRSPLMNTVRQHPLVHDFHERVYVPIRAKISPR